MDALDALAELQRAGFRHAISGGGLSLYERTTGPFSMQVEHRPQADELTMRLALAIGTPARYREWALPLPTPAALVAEALNFIRVFESSACVGGD